MVWWNKLQLRSKDPETRCQGIEKLAERGRLAELLNCLEDDSPRVRGAAAAAIGALRTEAAVNALIAKLSNPSGTVREAAAQGLAFAGDSRGIEALVARLSDPRPQVRAAVAATLPRLGWNPGSQEQHAMFSVATGQIRSALAAGEAAVDPLVRELKHDTAFVRRSVAEALETVDDPRVFQPLLTAARDPDPTVRVSVIHALGKVCNEPPTVKLLYRMVGDRDQHVRLAAVQVLARRANRDDAPVFVRLLKDPHFEIRQASADFLGRYGTGEHTGDLQSLLGDPDNDVRASAARALGEVGDKRCIGALVLLLADEDSGVRQVAESALGRIDAHWMELTSARQVLPALEKLLAIRPAWVQAAAQHVLVRLRPACAR